MDYLITGNFFKANIRIWGSIDVKISDRGAETHLAHGKFENTMEFDYLDRQ